MSITRHGKTHPVATAQVCAVDTGNIGEEWHLRVGTALAIPPSKT